MITALLSAQTVGVELVPTRDAGRVDRLTPRYQGCAATARYAVVMTATYLCIIGDAQALAWVLVSGQMAFRSGRRSEIDALDVGDNLLIMTTRGCFRSRHRDRARVIGYAQITSRVKQAIEPIELIGRTFDRTCTLTVTHLAPVLTGVELAPLIDRLDAFPQKSAWSAYLRRPLLRLSHADAQLLRKELSAVAVSPDQVIDGYIARGTPPRTQASRTFPGTQ
jgi:hypothetical protein